MLEKKQAVIFDLDGTLVDSMWVWNAIDLEFLGKYGYLPDEEMQHRIEGMSFTETAVFFKEYYGLEETVEEIGEAWNQMAEEKYRTQVALKPGIRPFLNLLKDRGIRVGIASSNSRRLIEEVLEARGIREYFSVIRTGCEVGKGKPEPDIYLSVARELGVAPGQCLVFEDVPMGILAGKRAGMEVCAVEDDFSAAQRERKRRMADYYIETYEELLREAAGE